MVAVAALVLLAACGGSDSGGSTEVDDDAVIIDVRTPEEFAAGHLEGALNIDVQSPDFDTRIADLDPDAAYFVYCRTGNRSGAAIERMATIGIADAVNGGGLEDAARSTGRDIVVP